MLSNKKHWQGAWYITQDAIILSNRSLTSNVMHCTRCHHYVKRIIDDLLDVSHKMSSFSQTDHWQLAWCVSHHVIILSNGSLTNCLTQQDVFNLWSGSLTSSLMHNTRCYHAVKRIIDKLFDTSHILTITKLTGNWENTHTRYIYKVCDCQKSWQKQTNTVHKTIAVR